MVTKVYNTCCSDDVTLVSVPCTCADELLSVPSRLWVTFVTTDGGSCACLNGLTFAIDYAGTADTCVFPEGNPIPLWCGESDPIPCEAGTDPSATTSVCGGNCTGKAQLQLWWLCDCDRRVRVSFCDTTNLVPCTDGANWEVGAGFAMALNACDPIDLSVSFTGAQCYCADLANGGTPFNFTIYITE